MKDRRRRRNQSVKKHENIGSNWRFSNFKRHERTRNTHDIQVEKEFNWKDSSLQSSLCCSRFSTNSRSRFRRYLRRCCQDYVFQNAVCYYRQKELRLRASRHHYYFSQRLIERKDIYYIFEELSRRRVCLIVKSSSI